MTDGMNDSVGIPPFIGLAGVAAVPPFVGMDRSNIKDAVPTTAAVLCSTKTPPRHSDGSKVEFRRNGNVSDAISSTTNVLSGKVSGNNSFVK